MLILLSFFSVPEKKQSLKKSIKKNVHLLVMNRNHPGFVSSSGPKFYDSPSIDLRQNA